MKEGYDGWDSLLGGFFTTFFVALGFITFISIAFISLSFLVLTAFLCANLQ